MTDVEYIGGGIATRQQDGSYDCNDCTNVGPQGAAGTWEDDDTRELLAQNRAQAYIQDRSCRWLCEQCWIKSLEKKDIEVPSA
eukprot:6036072-Pyramimonas_sp.AAC.1